MSFTMNEYHMAREHGGFSYQPATETREQGAVRSALELARDLHAYKNDPSAYVEWGPCDHAWDGDFPMAEGSILLDAVLFVDDEIVASLGAVNVYSERDPYCRIVEAELYGEYVYERKAADLRAAINAHCES